MAKFYGEIGFGLSLETPLGSGVYIDQIVKHNYYGDLLKNTSRIQSSESLNDNLNIANNISIMADPFANNNFHTMRYVEFMGSKWKITNVDVQYPRLVLTIGGVYNG